MKNHVLKHCVNALNSSQDTKMHHIMECAYTYTLDSRYNKTEHNCR